jgi:tRNA threonylcarbamoyladenosine biosynthesis protein TsaB
MIILALRTDKPQSEIYLYENNNIVAQLEWEAHRQLAETIHIKIRDLLKDHDKTWSDIEGVIIYKGPGSFTGLRIGMSVANALASSLQIPIAAATGEAWQDESIEAILAGKNEKIVSPDYGSDPHITQQKK